MSRYYFDIREGDDLTHDNEGLELASMEAVQLEAAHSLADMMRDVIRTRRQSSGHRMAIEVRDNNGPCCK